MRQDFANRMDVSTHHEPAHARSKSRKGLPSWQKVYQISRMKKVYFPMFIGGFIAILLLIMPSLSVDASVSMPHEEWLKPEVKTLEKAMHQQRIVLQTGDSSLSVLGRLGFSYADVMAMRKASKKVHPLEKVQAGHAFWREDDAQGTHVYYNLDASQRLHLSRIHDAWHAKVETPAVSHRQVYVSAIISDSLFMAAARAGLDNRTTMNLVDIFAWDIDFVRDLRKGDSFQVLYDEQYNVFGKMVGTTILAAEFVNQGHAYSAIRYHLKNGQDEYYSLDGKSLRKTYLKAPVKFTRISSRFRTARKHPVLGYTRAHKGVDYAARTGTPVHAIGNGRITYAGWRGGYGRLVAIQHNNHNHSTRYAHLSKFGRGIHKGVRVKQGQIIGYVGMSGLATGPHLHFEFRVRGRAVNPLHVKHAPAKPVPKAEVASFKQHAAQLQHMMKLEAKQSDWG